MSNKYLDSAGVTYLWSKVSDRDHQSEYNLGAYDTISGNVITRQTGYLTINAEDITRGTGSVTSGGSNKYFYSYITYKNLNVFENFGKVIGISNNGFYVRNYNSYWVNENTVGLLGNQVCIGFLTEQTQAEIQALCPIYIQYKLATSYTEEIIEGQPLITLDQQGSQWLRNEWEKGLNLLNTFDRSNIPSNSSLYNATLNSDGSYTSTATHDGRQWTYSNSDFKLHLTKGKYCLSGMGTISTGRTLTIEMYNSNNNLIVSVNSENNYKASFTLTSDTDVGIITKLYDGSNLKIMLNEGDHPYPYQAYNGEIVHDKDIADLYKQEYNLGYYDTMVENSDGTYTITRKTGYVDLGTLNWSVQQTSANYRFNAPLYKLVYGTSNVLCSKYNYVGGDATWNGVVGMSTDANASIIQICDTSYANATAFKNAMSGVMLQYELSTSYTERVEKNHYARYNQSFILEHNKNEAERSANLLDYSKIINNYTLTSSGQLLAYDGYYVTDFIRVEPNKTYTMSNSHDGTLYFYDINRNFVKVVENTAPVTFTTDSNVYYIRKSSPNTHTNIMINEGSVALPYQPYEGKVVHEKELESASVKLADNYKYGRGVTLPNSTSFTNSFVQDIFGTTDNGNYHIVELRAIREAPPSLLGDFSSGIAWRGNDTYGSLMVAYNTPIIRVSGGNGTNPSWYVDLVHNANFSTHLTTNLKTINGNSIVGSGDMSIKADSVFTEVTDVVDTFTINRNGTWLITCLGYNKIYASDNSSISFYGSALVSMTSAGSDPHICINGTAYACSSAITFVTSGIMQVYKKAN